MQGPVEDVLAWGWFALGWDERARAVRQRALESASEAEQGTKEIKLARMVAAIRWARSPEGTQAVEDYLELLEWEAAEIAARIEAQLAERSARRFPEQHAEEGWWHGQLGDLIARLVLLDSLLAEDAVVPGYGWSVPRRLGFARELEVGFAAGGAYARDWAQALPAIRAAYPGLALEPQMGLVPIGPDPDSRLWEFAHLMSGAPARRGADGKLALVEESGLVLVLLPGGAFRMGAQKDEARGNFDPEAMWWEGPVHEVWLSPFLLSKYEMTREQWLRLTGEDPAEGVLAEGARLPIQSITWRESFDWLARSGLILPSEARWEYGARAGTDTPWFTGADPATIGEQRVANLADRSAVELDLQLSATEDWSDGFHWTAPVGSFLPSAFGLHDVLGNVGEFCLDGFLPRFYANCSWSDPVAPWEGSPVVFYRGGAWYDVATGARASRRDDRLKDSPNSGIGVRPARDLER
jgi:formylglycine-generating enzyme required for sulfatase activity